MAHAKFLPPQQLHFVDKIAAGKTKRLGDRKKNHKNNDKTPCSHSLPLIPHLFIMRTWKHKMEQICNEK